MQQNQNQQFKNEDKQPSLNDVFVADNYSESDKYQELVRLSANSCFRRLDRFQAAAFYDIVKEANQLKSWKFSSSRILDSNQSTSPDDGQVIVRYKSAIKLHNNYATEDERNNNAQLVNILHNHNMDELKSLFDQLTAGKITPNALMKELVLLVIYHSLYSNSDNSDISIKAATTEDLKDIEENLSDDLANMKENSFAHYLKDDIQEFLADSQELSSLTNKLGHLAAQLLLSYLEKVEDSKIPEILRQLENNMAQDHILLEILYEEAVENGTESAQKIAAQLEELRCCTPSDQKSAKQIRTIEDADTPNWCPNQQLYSQDDFATDKALYQQLCDMIGQVLVYIQENAGSLSQEIDNGRIINALTLFRENANGALQLFNLPKPDAKNYYSSYFKCRLMSLNLRRERGTQNNLDISNSLFNQLKDSATTAVNKLYPLQKITVIDKLFNFLCSIFRIQYTKVAVKQHLTEQLGQIRRTLDGQLFEQSVGSAAEQAAQSEQSANRVPVL